MRTLSGSAQFCAEIWQGVSREAGHTVPTLCIALMQSLRVRRVCGPFTSI